MRLSVNMNLTSHGVGRQQATALPRCHLLRKRGSNPDGNLNKKQQMQIVSEKLIITRNRVVAKQSRREENTIVGNYFL